MISFIEFMEFLLKYSPLLTALLIVVILFQLRSQNKQLKVQTQQAKESAYSETLEKIIHMKNWAYGTEHIPKSIKKNTDWFPKPDTEGYAGYKTFDEFFIYCTLFYNIERIYHQANSVSISPGDKRGLLKEMSIWLNVPDARLYYDNFARRFEAHSESFMNAMQRHYYPESALVEE